MNTRPDIKLFQTPRNSSSNTRKFPAPDAVRMFGDLSLDRAGMRPGVVAKLAAVLRLG
jgi:hypothetical protein